MMTLNSSIAKQRGQLFAAAVILSCVLFVFSGCKNRNELSPAVKSGAMLYVAQAQFVDKIGEDGKMHPVPGPARLGIWSKANNGWIEEVLEDPQSNVFHKAAWFAPVGGEPEY
jgi:hypothetical protein